MKDQVLTIEQMRILESKGVDISFDHRFLNWCAGFRNPQLCLGITGKGICRAFTVAELLAMLPKTIKDNVGSVKGLIIEITHVGLWKVGYRKGFHGHGGHADESIIVALYNTIIWLIDNRYELN